MSYNYSEVKPNLFTDEGQRLFLKIRDTTQKMLTLAGAVRCQEVAMRNAGSSWDMLACMDRQVELGEIVEITKGDVPGRHRVFVNGREQ